MTLEGASLSRLERAVCAVVGLATGGAGGVAVFVDGSNVGGVPLLIGVGALFGYLAVSGQRLSQVKVGNSEASFIGRILRDPTVSDEAKAEVAERLDEVPLPSGTQRAVNEILDARAAADAYRRQVIGAVERLAGAEITARATEDQPPRHWDLLLGSGDRIAVEITWRGRPQTPDQVTEMLQMTAAHSFEAYGLIITNQPVPGGARYEPQDELWLGVSWSSPADDVNLAAALQELLRASRAD
ncbi:hypothetical protein [Kribbella sindirgiensis]|uniref:Uncharacterized protein n=1 Tax=Kribbella sindirgiensis TaxID=1124744 RepID=A0A4R0J1F9_9ACTN|nr:hypothetical protein [Kribbella sindirgiensis]TCC39487.1 hypothetical protein E0H50_06040 [Kribbella sindirgiensis]